MRYYFDTSIWLDLFEEREEHNKFAIAKALLEHIRIHQDTIVYSKAIIDELIGFGYTKYELLPLFQRFSPLLSYIWQNSHHYGKAKDLASKRNVPLFDALHALLARESRAILITRDRDFQHLKDIVVTKSPEDLL